MSGKSVASTKPVDMELIYAALITYPDDNEAQNFMLENGYEVSASKMAVFRRGATELVTSPYYKPFQERREKLAPLIQQQLENDLLGIANSGTVAVQFAVDQAQEQLANGQCADPARTARDLMQVVTQSVDKRQLLKGQPTEITQNRSVDELLNALVAMKVAERIEPRADANGTAIEEAAQDDADDE